MLTSRCSAPRLRLGQPSARGRAQETEVKRNRWYPGHDVPGQFDSPLPHRARSERSDGVGAARGAEVSAAEPRADATRECLSVRGDVSGGAGQTDVGRGFARPSDTPRGQLPNSFMSTARKLGRGQGLAFGLAVEHGIAVDFGNTRSR